MEELANDPIIAFYMKMSQVPDDKAELPLYSETMLRLSFKELFGTLRPLNPEELKLYRKLLLLYYAQKYESMSDLIAIMTCFEEIPIWEHLDNQQQILDEWQIFFNNNLACFVYKVALNEMLFEYVRRYILLFGQIAGDLLKPKAEEIQTFLGSEVKLTKKWLRHINSVLKNKLEQTQRETNSLDTKDLELENIFEDIKHKLNNLVVKNTTNRLLEHNSSAEEHCNEPPEKKLRIEKCDTLDIEIMMPEAAEKQIESVSETHTEVENEASNDSFADSNEVEIIDIKISDDDETDIDNESQPKAKENLDNSDEIDTDSDEQDECEIIETTDLPCKQRIIDDKTASSYLAALQAYAVVNAHSEAIEFLDKVDNIFRKNTKQK